VLKILVVEDDAHLANTVKYLVEDNPRYRVVAIADDAESAIAAANEYRPQLALVDLHLARGSTGFSVAVHLSEADVPCLFVSGKAPSFPMPAEMPWPVARARVGNTSPGRTKVVTFGPNSVKK